MVDRISVAKEKVNILLVDDQPAKLLSYQAILDSLEENLVLASSGREALEQLLKQEFAVILVDVCMPEQDGFELVEMIRAHHRFKKTAIIFVSAIQMTDLDRVRGYASGAVDYVSVPIVPEILRARVGVFVELFRKTRQLESLNAELEERVLERTSRLSETEEALREANLRKDIFLATLAHELRNPLAPIKSALDLFQSLMTNDLEGTRAIRVMDRQLDQLTRLIDDLMDLSRITRGKLELRKAPVDAASVLTAAIEAVRPAFEAANQNLQASEPSDQIVVEVDATRISQVISNLLLNASKYTDPGGTIRVGFNRDGSDLVLKVADDGSGIAPEEMSRVFEPFYQAEEARKTGKSGLGIGLTLVRTIVERHEGEVTISSEGPGKGSEFVVRLPCIVESPLPEPVSENISPPCGGRKILVVDDNRDAADILALLLRRRGNHVEIAYDGCSAIECARQLRPHLVVMDLGMPGLDGFATAREMRAQPWGTELMLVAVTGWGQQEDRQRTRDAGFDHHFVKPVPFAEFERLLAAMDLSQPLAPVTRSSKR